jgi:hypothetical protein
VPSRRTSAFLPARPALGEGKRRVLFGCDFPRPSPPAFNGSRGPTTAQSSALKSVASSRFRRRPASGRTFDQIGASSSGSWPGPSSSDDRAEASGPRCVTTTRDDAGEVPLRRLPGARPSAAAAARKRRRRDSDPGGEYAVAVHRGQHCDLPQTMRWSAAVVPRFGPRYGRPASRTT